MANFVSLDNLLSSTPAEAMREARKTSVCSSSASCGSSAGAGDLPAEVWNMVSPLVMCASI